MTICSACTGEVEDDSVTSCLECEADGLCPECKDRHDEGDHDEDLPPADYVDGDDDD